MSAKRPRRCGCLVVMAILFSLAVFIVVVGIVSPSLTDGWRRRLSQSDQYGADEFPPLHEVRAYGTGSNKVVQVVIRGMISLEDESGFLPRRGTAAQALLVIRRATHDPGVMALILDIDSGGGGITASDVLLHEIKRFRQAHPDRRVVAICGDVAASGAYYVALGADHIIAHPTTLTGSIGVMLQSLNLRTLGEKLGIADVTIKSGPNKDLLNPLTDITPAQRAMLQQVIDQMHTRFIRLVAESRGMTEEQVRAVADGSIFPADKAVAAGLMDEIGYWQDAMTRTAELLHVDRIAVYRYETGFSFSSLLRGRLQRSILADAADLLESRSPLMYRWSY